MSLVFAAPVALAAFAAASAFADLAAIDHAVATFAGSGATPVDRRLRLKPCDTPLALSWRTEGRESVLVQCGDAGGWRLFVPVSASGSAGAVVINRGDAVTIAVSGEGFTVAQPGEAMEAGALGAWIRVRTAAARPGDEAMRAQVVRPGVVTLPLP